MNHFRGRSRLADGFLAPTSGHLAGKTRAIDSKSPPRCYWVVLEEDADGVPGDPPSRREELSVTQLQKMDAFLLAMDNHERERGDGGDNGEEENDLNRSSSSLPTAPIQAHRTEVAGVPVSTPQAVITGNGSDDEQTAEQMAALFRKDRSGR